MVAAVRAFRVDGALGEAVFFWIGINQAPDRAVLRLTEGQTLDRFTAERWSRPILAGDIVPAVVMSVIGTPIRPMAAEGNRLVMDPLPIYPKEKIITAMLPMQNIFTCGMAFAELTMKHRAMAKIE